jgi:hypothetical protein
LLGLDFDFDVKNKTKHEQKSKSKSTFKGVIIEEEVIIETKKKEVN